MNYFEKALENYLGKDNLNKIQHTKIGIAGAGGLGSNVAQSLVRCGFKNFVIVDFDNVEYSNLNRQFYFVHQVGIPKVMAIEANLKLINEDLNITPLNIRLDKINIYTVFKECDIVIEAVDIAETKAMFLEELANTEKLIIMGNGIAGFGNSDEIKINKVNELLYIVGDLHTEVSKKSPPLSPKVNITAAKQADIVLEYVLK